MMNHINNVLKVYFFYLEVANLPELWTCSHGNFKCGSVAEIAPISEADVQRILDAYQSKLVYDSKTKCAFNRFRSK